MVLPNGQLASGSDDHTIKVWDLASKACVQTLSGHTDWVSSLAVLPSGQLVSGSGDKKIKLWSVESGACLQTLVGHTDWVSSLAVLPSGLLASGSKDKTIKVWDVESGECTQTLAGHTDYVRSLVVLPSGQLASGSDDHTIKVWDVEEGACVQTVVGRTHCLVVLPNGQLASGSWDHTIKLWEVESGRCVQTLSGHTSWVVSLVVLPNGQLASGSGAMSFDDGSTVGKIKVWDVGCGLRDRYRQLKATLASGGGTIEQLYEAGQLAYALAGSANYACQQLQLAKEAQRYLMQVIELNSLHDDAAALLEQVSERLALGLSLRAKPGAEAEVASVQTRDSLTGSVITPAQKAMRRETDKG